MYLPNIWELCSFSDEIVYGKFDRSKFAVELHSVLDNTADVIYKDPKIFLDKTHLTNNMKYILKEVLLRIARNEGNPVYVIDTEFGGGKTHTLLLLYHILNNKELGTEYIKSYNIDKEYNILEVPDAKVVAIDCNKVSKKTLWGEIADAIDKYELLKYLDEREEIPKDITLLKQLFDKPTLLLIDELPEYLLKADSRKIGNVTLADLTITFIQDLIRAISSVNNCMLIITLTASQKLYETYSKRMRDKIKSIMDFRVDNITSDLKESLSRQAQFIVPVSKEEVYDVIVKRLVKDRRDYEQVIDAYYDYYNSKGLVYEPNYRDKMVKAYPFHPFLIDTLYDRVSSIDKFNKTRGMLRLLALVLNNIYKNKHECKLVSTGDIDLTEPLIKEDLTDSIDFSDFKPVIESDCISKAKKLDMNKSIKLAEKIARTIYIYSLISAVKVSGIKPSELKLAVCYPNIDPSLVDEVLEEIDKEFWYIKRIDSQFYFTKKPNINKVIEDHMREVKEEEIRDVINNTLKELLKQKSIFDIKIWNRSELEDNKKLKLFVVDYNDISSNEEHNKRLFNDIIEKSNGNIRSYQNTLVLLAPDYYGIDNLKLSAKRVIACQKAMKDERIKFDKDEEKKAKSRLEEFNANLEQDCINTYSKVVYPYSSEIRIDAISFFDSKKGNLIDAIIELLKRKGKLVESINPEVIADRVDKVPVDRIYEEFLRNRNEKFIAYPSKILDAIRDGIAKGLFGYADRLEEIDGKYKAIINRYVEVNWNDGWLINKDLIYEEPIEDKEPIMEGSNGETIKYPTTPTIEVKQKNRYIIRLESIDDAIKVLPIVNVVTVGINADKRLSAELSNDNGDIIKIDSRLRNVEEIKSILNQLKYRYNGSASIEIITDKDISNELENYKVRYERV
jgi:hypothetical protein